MTIDGKDIAIYGCTFLTGTLDSIFKYPKRTPVEFNNYAETSGIDPDLTSVDFEQKIVHLNFLMQAVNLSDFLEKYNQLITDVSAPGKRTVNMGNGIVCALRFDSGSLCEAPLPLFNDKENVAAFSLDFIDDNPSYPDVYPIIGIPDRGLFAINGVDFGEFGICSGEQIADILKYPAVKTPFTDGKNVSLDTIQFQHKDIKLKLWQKACNKEEFINNHAAFFRELSKPDLQSLYVSELGNIDMFYTDCPSYKLDLWNENLVVSRFEIVLTIPVVTWIDAGGSIHVSALFDLDAGFLSDENGNILTLK